MISQMNDIMHINKLNYNKPKDIFRLSKHLWGIQQAIPFNGFKSGLLDGQKSAAMKPLLSSFYWVVFASCAGAVSC